MHVSWKNLELESILFAGISFKIVLEIFFGLRSVKMFNVELLNTFYVRVYVLIFLLAITLITFMCVQ